MFLYALTIFVSAFLLFLVQPIIAKQILPWFGGTAAVWTTCMVFFQLTLLLGYFYSDWVARKLLPKTQAMLQVALLGICVALLPITPDPSWKPAGDEVPSLRILLLLTVTIGLPYFLLSTTSPLVQAWFARTYPDARPYRLFALSNLASMLALIGYPFVIEPWISTLHQARWWSAGFAAFAILCGASAWFAVRSSTKVRSDSGPITITGVGNEPAYTPPPSAGLKFTWTLLAALGSMLLLAITNHLTQNISSIPLLWVVPLTIYLMTFILCFNGQGWYPRKLYLPLLVAFLASMGWALADRRLEHELYWQIGIFSSGLFIACMFCHGELVRLKPVPRYLTTFYLMVSLGGALGAVLVGIVAPLILPAYFELEITLTLVAVMAAYLLRNANRLVVGVAALLTLFMIGSGAYAVHEFIDNTMVMTRNFYGTLRVKEYNTPADENYNRTLVHGTILHGAQFLQPKHRRIATSYYKTTSGIGRTLLLKQQLNPDMPMKVGIIGLGAGTIATYGRKGDTYRFYDINPAVVEIAKRDFHFLSDSSATIETVLGDARLSMEREASQQFDVLAIDAFSSDSIPVHLITDEVMDVYLRHMKEGGIVAFHVSNRFLDLKPVVLKFAEKRGLQAGWIHEGEMGKEEASSTNSDWVLITRDKNFFLRDQIIDVAYFIAPQPGWRIWTDDFNNLLQVLR